MNSVKFKIGSKTSLPLKPKENGVFYLAKNDNNTDTTMYLSDENKIIPVNSLQATQDDQGNIIANTYINNLDIQGNKLIYDKPNNKTSTELILPNRDGIVVDTIEPTNEETVLWVNPNGESDIYATTNYVNQQLSKKANIEMLGDQVIFRVEGDSLIITSK